MDLEKQLNDLIIKYRLDCESPDFQKYLQGIELLQKIITSRDNVLLASRNVNDNTMVEHFCPYRPIPKYSIETQELSDTNEMNFNLVILTSYEISIKDFEILEHAFPDATVVHLYDYFRVNGLFCSSEFYDVLRGKRIENIWGNITNDFSCQRYYQAISRDKMEYMNVEIDDEKEKALAKVIFDYLFIRDFKGAEFYISEYISRQYSGYEEYQSFLEELKKMLSYVKERTCSKEGNIFLIWMDALGYGEEQGMAFVEKMMEESLFFKNAYTVMTTTSPTMKAMFCGKTPIDEAAYQIKRIRIDDSTAMGYLKRKGYSFKYFGSLECFDDKLYGKHGYTPHTPASMIHWDILCDLYDAETPVFYLIHNLAETHPPFENALIEEVYVSHYATNYLGENEEQKRQTYLNYRNAKQYYDEQLKLFYQFLPEEDFKIFMSDHHSGMNPKRQLGKGTHIHFFVCRKDIKPECVSRMFSLLDFDSLIRYVCNPKDGLEQIRFRDTVPIQWLDFYHPGLANKVANPENFTIYAQSHRGVVTQQEEYLRFANGKEMYFVAPSFVNRIDFPECQERVEFLRKMAGDKFIDVEKDEFFKHSRKIRRAIARYMERTGGEELGVKLLREAVAAIKENQIIAIRGGGKHTIRVFSVLGRLSRRIRYLVDRDLTNMEAFGGPGLYLEFITPEEMNEKKIDVVILSSLKYRKEMKEELIASGRDYRIIDVYEMLEEKGIFLDRGFYEERFLPEDFEDLE